jgi:hypothetical protein
LRAAFRTVLRAVLRAAGRLAVLRAVLRTALRAVLRDAGLRAAVLRAVFRLAAALRRAGLLRAVVFLVVRFFPVVLVAIGFAPILFCDVASTRSTDAYIGTTLHLVQACRPTWQVNYFFSVYALCTRKWQFGEHSSPNFNNQFFLSAPAYAGKCTSPRILIRFVKHMHRVYTRRPTAADAADALFLPQRTQKMRRQR